jgi:glycolate oxidase
VASNAGGAHCFRYGVTSHYVLGVEVVLLDGTVHRFGGPAGGRGPWREDWRRFMVGSEGTLGAFTRFWLRLLPLPEKVWTLRATYPDLRSIEAAIHALVAHPSFPAAIEMLDPRGVAMVEGSRMAAGLPRGSFMLLTEIDGPAALVDARVAAVAELLRRAGSDDVDYSDEEATRRRLWKARKAAAGSSASSAPTSSSKTPSSPRVRSPKSSSWCTMRRMRRASSPSTSSTRATAISTRTSSSTRGCRANWRRSNASASG